MSHLAKDPKFQLMAQEFRRVFHDKYEQPFGVPLTNSSPFVDQSHRSITTMDHFLDMSLRYVLCEIIILWLMPLGALID